MAMGCIAFHRNHCTEKFFFVSCFLWGVSVFFFACEWRKFLGEKGGTILVPSFHSMDTHEETHPLLGYFLCSTIVFYQ